VVANAAKYQNLPYMTVVLWKYEAFLVRWLSAEKFKIGVQA